MPTTVPLVRRHKDARNACGASVLLHTPELIPFHLICESRTLASLLCDELALAHLRSRGRAAKCCCLHHFVRPSRCSLSLWHLMCARGRR
eukprot:2727783-Pleurochrysis_carterae.AAC.10